MPFILSFMRPSCGSLRSDMSSSDMIFRRLVRAAREPHRRLHRLVEHSVHPVAHAEGFFIGLYMDVARALGYGVGQDEVHELYDGRVLDRLPQVAQVDVFLFPVMRSTFSSPSLRVAMTSLRASAVS